LSDVPSAKIVEDGKLGGDVPKNDGPRPPVHKRRLSNYLLDKKLQLRYILLVTVLSGMIAGSLGFLIFQQRHSASASIESDLAALTENDSRFADLQTQLAENMESQDRTLIYTMIGVGLGLVVILSTYLVIMTHKVAGPLHKISTYFDRMAEGKLGAVSALRRGDMLQDFFGSFRDMHEAVRARAKGDAEAKEKAAVAVRAALGDKGQGAHDDFDRHVATRQQQLT
jgi:hypothetical protein